MAASNRSRASGGKSAWVERNSVEFDCGKGEFQLDCFSFVCVVSDMGGLVFFFRKLWLVGICIKCRFSVVLLLESPGDRWRIIVRNFIF